MTTIEQICEILNATPDEGQGAIMECYGLHHHHTAWKRGYESRNRDNDRAEPYHGKFGTGVAMHAASYQSSQYHHITYWIFDKE